jgi:hypothetical protein
MVNFGPSKEKKIKTKRYCVRTHDPSLKTPLLRFSSAPVTKQVPPLILRGTWQTPARFVRIPTVDETHAIARRCRHPFRTLKLKKDRTRAIRSVARLDARQQHGIIYRGVPQRRIAGRRTRRLGLQRRGWKHQRALLLLLLILWLLFLWGVRRKLAAARERDRAEPTAVRFLARRTGLQGRVNVSAAGEREEACGEVGEIGEEGRRDVVG